MESRELSVALRSPLFQLLGPDLSSLLAASGAVREYRRGEMVFWQGEPADRLLVVLSGCLKLCRETANHDHEVIGLLAAGQIYFEPAMFVDGRHHVIAEAVSSARVASVEAEALREAILRRPELAFSLFALASTANKGLVEQVEQLKTRSVPQRIAAFLLDQAERAPASQSFALPFSKTLIARFVGAKLESFSRSLVHLADQGVQIVNDRVTLQDAERLAHFARGTTAEAPHDRRPILTRFASMGRRRKFDDGLVRSWRKAESAGAPISMLLIDVGPRGESDRGLLVAVGDAIAREADRDGKFMVHCGGGIFAVAAPKTDRGGAMRLAERLTTVLENDASRRADGSVVAAIGSATIFPTAQDHIEKIVCFADIALYQAKKSGRGEIRDFFDGDPACQVARASPSGGARIPVIESSHCAICRKDAPCL